jgi:hypothetical protein
VAYKDGETFTTYCDKPYDRHRYKMILNNGKAIILEDYEMVRAYWYHYKEHMKTVEVLDA